MRFNEGIAALSPGLVALSIRALKYRNAGDSSTYHEITETTKVAAPLTSIQAPTFLPGPIPKPTTTGSSAHIKIKWYTKIP